IRPMIAPTGVARIIRSLPWIASTGSSVPKSMARMARARSNTGFRSQPMILPAYPAAFRASPMEPPIRPVPMMVICLKGMVRSERVMPLNESSSHRWSNHSQLTHELGELLRIQGLCSVGKRFVRAIVNLNQKTVCSGGDGRAPHRSNLVAASGAVRGIGHNGQVGQFFDDWDGGDIERVASVRLKSADTALANDHIVITAGQQIFG